MMLKRWGLNVLAMLVGLGVGVAVVNYAYARTPMPPVAGFFLILFFAALFYAISHVAAPKIFPGPSVSEFFEAGTAGRPWAWLKPAGIAPRSPFPLNRDQVILGRDVRCDVMLNNDSISRRHAEIVRMAEGWLIRDLGSQNGTYVNGQRVQECVLHEGDLITIGDVNLNFEGPRQPVREGGPETVAAPVFRPGLGDGPETSVYRGESQTEVWRPRRD